MIHEIQLVLSPEEAANDATIRSVVAQQLFTEESAISFIRTIKRSIDARSANIKVNLKVEAYVNEPAPESNNFQTNYPDVSNSKSAIIIGAGPAGLFAALQLIEKGIKPIVVERGKDVKSRRRDLAAINKLHLVNPDSNYCFGEGGAGTYSDGKLYTRSKKRGDVNKILEIFVAHGADENILVEAHPHIGTNKLPKIIENIRATIINHGGQVHFNSFVNDILIEDDKVIGVRGVNIGKNSEFEFISENIILATGHSSRDIFKLLYDKGVKLEAKTFAMGVRVEHQQSLIDAKQYHCKINEVEQKRKYLPAASYSLVHQAMGRGVYSFCMCPGGIIAPCATDQEEIVTNGWSPSKRNNPFANSGIVVTIEPEDYQQYSNEGPLAPLRYQQALEKMAWNAAGNSLDKDYSGQIAPAQRLQDFVDNKLSNSIQEVSYHPGVTSAPLHELLPEEIGKRLQIGFKAFGKKIRNYLSNEAVIVGVESRTSSPIRISRDKESLEHIQIKGLYPCGEGAGYAGGIVSAAIDGQKCAIAISQK